MGILRIRFGSKRHPVLCAGKGSSSILPCTKPIQIAKGWWGYFVSLLADVPCGNHEVLKPCRCFPAIGLGVSCQDLLLFYC
jgi:hypothetical protein